jgi:hypothetical protein
MAQKIDNELIHSQKTRACTPSGCESIQLEKPWSLPSSVPRDSPWAGLHRPIGPDHRVHRPEGPQGQRRG